MHTIIIGVSSGIAAFKIVDLIKLLRKDHVAVKVIMTQNAGKMVDQKEFSRASGNKILTELFPKNFDYTQVLKDRHVEHIDVADSASIVVIAPATANTIAKLANGFVDDYLTTVVLATTAPVLVCPSMNVHMWLNPITQENIQKLKQRGFYIIEPSSGALACGYDGPGRLVEPEVIYKQVTQLLATRNSLTGKKILVTAGATSERVDDVRVLTNRASGKMGIALAEEAKLRGAAVLLLRSNNIIQSRMHIHEEFFETAEELENLIKKHAKQFDIIFHTAAVSDFAPEKKINGKQSSNKGFSLHFIPKDKIIDKIKLWNPQIKLISFKAEWGGGNKELVEKARSNMERTGSDVIVVNDVSKPDRGFGVDTNEVHVILNSGKTKTTSLCSKRDVAHELMHMLLINEVI